MPERDRELIYVSHRRPGARQLVDRLVDQLARRLPGFEICHDSTSHQTGAEWPDQMREALDRAVALLVVIGDDWLKHYDAYFRRKLDLEDDPVRREIETAFESRTRVIPILIDGAQIPPAEALPASLRPLTRLQAVSIDSRDATAGAEAIATQLERAAASGGDTDGLDGPPFQLHDIEITNFRAFDHLRVDLRADSDLPGHWTCIAGINGAGKSTILQAIALLLMGPDRARELGGKRLDGMRRRDGSSSQSVLRGNGRLHGKPFSLEMTIGSRGPRGDGSFWSLTPDVVIAGYGATRNLSEIPDLSSDLSDPVRGCVNLFQPMSRLQFADLILKKSDGSPPAKLGAKLFRELVDLVFEGQLRLDEPSSKRTQFAVGDSAVDALDLPDGFRSSVAWMADLCVRWAVHTTRARRKKATSVQEMAGIALIDELDLHLHPSLQRSIVPDLRRALPHLQFVVTSHSPLVLASFDRRELIPLDRREADGIRELDRQILGFTPNQVYEWLLGTPPSSAALDAEIASADHKDRRAHLAQMLLQDTETDPNDAQDRLSRIRSMLGKLK